MLYAIEVISQAFDLLLWVNSTMALSEIKSTTALPIR